MKTLLFTSHGCQLVVKASVLIRFFYKVLPVLGGPASRNSFSSLRARGSALIYPRYVRVSCNSLGSLRADEYRVLIYPRHIRVSEGSAGT